MGQILSAICGEKFVTSPATLGYSNDGYAYENEAGIGSSLRPWKGDDSDEEGKPLIFQLSRGLVFQILLETAAKKVVEDCSKNYESITGKKEIVEDDSSDDYSLGNEAGTETSTIPLNGDIDKPAIFQSRGPVLQVRSEPVEKKGNDDNPLTFNGTEQRKEVCHHKDEAINKKWMKKKIVEDGSKNEAIVEDGVSIKTALLLQKGNEEKPLIFQLSGGPVFQVHIDPVAKKGNGKPLADQKNKQRKEVDHRKNVAINRPLNLIWKETVKDGNKNEAILIKSSNVTKGIVEDLCKNEAILIKSLNATKKTEIVEDLCKNEAINKKWKKVFKGSGNNEVIVEDGISIKTSLLLRKEDKYKPSRGPVSHVLVKPVVKKGNEKQDQSNKQIKEVSHHKDVAINKRRRKKKMKKNKIVEDNSKNVDKEKSLIFESSCGPVFKVNIKSALKDENGKPLTNQSNTVYNNKTINKACTSMWKKKIVEDKAKHVNFKEPIARKGIDKPLVDFSKELIKEIVHHNETINKALIVKEEKPLMIQSLVEPAAKKAPLADFNSLQVKETGHHKDEAINKVLTVAEEKPVIFEVLKEAATEKVNDNKPLADFSYDHIKEIHHHKDETPHKNYLGTNEIVWLKHYNNKQKILMVGEGDFSFSASLAVAFCSSASNITATSFNDSEYLRINYKNAMKNIKALTDEGATVRHGVDATKMSNYSYWKGIKFDRIIYNFPYSGCPKSESRQTQLRQHLKLVRGFLLNAKQMLEEDGEIHISHKTNGFHSDWKLTELAFLEGLLLVKEAKFDKSDYPGYETKQGYHGNMNFQCYPSSTYMFASIPY